MKIWKLEQLHQQKLDTAVQAKAEELIQLLNHNYGEEREVNNQGGYILFHPKAIEEFSERYPTAIPEYMDYFQGEDSNRYVELLFLLSSDDPVIIYLREEVLHQTFEDWVHRFNDC